jgi:hypothetical protein
MQRAMAQKPITQGPSLLGAVLTTGLDIFNDTAGTSQSSGTLLEGPRTEAPQGGFDRIKNMLSII